MKNNELPVALAVILQCAAVGQAAEKSSGIGTQIVPITGSAKPYKDGRPAAKYCLDAVDYSRILRHGDGPGECDKNGAREAIVFKWKSTYHLHYDGAGPQGWLACLATSKDLTNWTRQGPVLAFGPKGSLDSGTASSPWVYKDRKWWHMFYVATPGTTPGPEGERSLSSNRGDDELDRAGRPVNVLPSCRRHSGSPLPLPGVCV